MRITCNNGGIQITAAGVLIAAAIPIYLIIHYWWIVMIVLLFLLAFRLIARIPKRYSEIRQQQRAKQQQIIDRMLYENAAYNIDPNSYVRNIQQYGEIDVTRKLPPDYSRGCS